MPGKHGPEIARKRSVQQEPDDFLPVFTAPCSAEAGLMTGFCQLGMLENLHLFGI